MEVLIYIYPAGGERAALGAKRPCKKLGFNITPNFGGSGINF